MDFQCLFNELSVKFNSRLEFTSSSAESETSRYEEIAQCLTNSLTLAVCSILKSL